MVNRNDLSKVLKVLETVLNDCLSVNRDDTLIEKLFTFLRHHLDLDSEDKESVLKCLDKSIHLSINELMADNDCNDWSLIAIKLRICGSLLADKDLFVCQQNCLKFIELISTEVINSNKSSLKFSFFRCLNDICVHRLALDWCLTTTQSNSTTFRTFPQLLGHFLNKTETRFVEREVLKLFISLLNHSLSQTDLTQDFEVIVSELISSANPSNIEIIREIIVSIESKHHFIQRYRITDVLINSIELWSEKYGEKLFILSQILGLCVESNEKAVEIMDKLILLKDLKALIAFLTQYIECNTNYDKNVLEKCFHYTIGWFALKCQQTDCFDVLISDPILTDKVSDKTISDYCLKQLIKLDLNCFEDKQIETIFKVMSKFVELNYKTPEMRKTLLQSFCLLENICLNTNLEIKSIEYFVEIYSQLLAFLSNDFKLIVLKSLRILIANKVWPKTHDSGDSAVIKVIQQLNQTLNEFDVENNWEITDSTLEVIYYLFSSLTKNGIKLISICPQLLTTILSLWTTNQENMCSTMRSTSVSVLLLIHLNTWNDNLNQLYDIKDNNCKDLKSLSSLLLTDELNVKIIIIKAFDENIDSLIELEKQLLEEIIRIVCNLAINDLDEDLQTNGLKFLQHLFERLCQPNELWPTVNIFLNSYYFHIIFHLMNCSEYLFKVKQICVQIIGYFQKALKGCQPILESMISKELPKDSNCDPKLKQIISIESKKIFDFIMDFNVKTFEENESEDRPKLNVLDDILSASLIDTNILIDCY